MKRPTSVFVSLLAQVCLCGSFAWSQAHVNENQETAVLYVDATHGSDSNPGTQQRPLKTISAAASLAMTNNESGIGTKVIINPGTYRESVDPPSNGNDTGAPITFQAATTGTAIVSGADVWTSWQPYSGNSSIYTHSWSYKWGLCAMDAGGIYPEEDIVRRREMIIVNGAPMTQVMNLSAVRVGTFYVDEQHSTAYVWPPSGTSMSSAKVEVATRPNLFTLGKLSNMVLRGLTFQYANSCRLDSAVPVNALASNILIDNDYFYWNNSAGLKLQSTTDTTVQNSVGNHNGGSGMMGYQTKDDLWQNNQTRYNGWRGAQGVYYDWGVAGTHFGLAHNQTLKNIDSSFNQTFGFHWDTDDENDVADSLIASENQLGEAFVEKSQGPMTISSSYFCSGKPFSGPNNLGLELRNSTNLTLTGDTFLNNGSELFVTGLAGGIKITNWETGQNYNLVSQNLTLTNSILEDGSSQMLFKDGALDGRDWITFQTTLASDYNTWWNSTDTNVIIVPVPKIWTKVDFQGWQAATGNDIHSVWKQPGNPGGPCSVNPDSSDFWFIMDAFDGYQTVSRGQSISFTAYVVPLAFNGTVTLASDGTKGVTGMSGSWSPATITQSGTTTFTVTTSGSTPRKDYPITLIATSGSVTHTMTVTVTVK